MKPSTNENISKPFNFNQYTEGTALFMGHHVTSEQMLILEKFLEDNSQITKLMFPTNALEEEDFIVFARNKTLKLLVLLFDTSHRQGFQITDKALELLCENTTLEELRIHNQEFGPSGAKILAESTIPKMTLSYNSIGKEGAIAIAKNTYLRELRIDDNTLENEGIIALSKNTNLISLDLTVDMIDTQALISLGKNTNLQTLKLSNNLIDDVDAIALAKSIPSGTKLKVLDLSINDIGSNGALALSKCPSIVEFNLEYNQINDKGAFAFLKNKALKSLKLKGNPISNLEEIENEINRYSRVRQNANMVFLAYLGINYQLVSTNGSLHGLEDVFLLLMRDCDIPLEDQSRKGYFNLLAEFREFTFFKNNVKAGLGAKGGFETRAEFTQEVGCRL